MERYLTGIPLFRTLPTAAMRRLNNLLELRQFHKGDVIFKEGAPADAVWIVKRGWVYLVKRTPQGGLATIFAMTPDEAICGVSAFDRGTYSAAAVAATASQVIRIPAPAFAALLEEYPRFAKEVLFTCCTRMRHMAESISLSAAPVAQRLAYALLRLRANFGDTVPITHQELARMAGTRLETSIRTFSTLKRRGWLATGRGRVTILNPAGLRGLLAAPSGGNRLATPADVLRK